jgi:hypothetical protein
VLLMYGGALLLTSEGFAASGYTPVSAPAAKYRYSVVGADGRAETVTVGPNAVTAYAPGDQPRPTTLNKPGQRMLTSPWRCAGVYSAVLNAISEAPELATAPGPWAVSIDFD